MKGTDAEASATLSKVDPSTGSTPQRLDGMDLEQLKQALTGLQDTLALVFFDDPAGFNKSDLIKYIRSRRDLLGPCLPAIRGEVAKSKKSKTPKKPKKRSKPKKRRSSRRSKSR